MISFKIILLLGWMAFATCELDYGGEDNCMWTECSHPKTDDYFVCHRTGSHRIFSGETSKSDCHHGFKKRYCCHLYPPRDECMWTASCYAPVASHQFACDKEFLKFRTPGRKMICGMGDARCYECCRS